MDMPTIKFEAIIQGFSPELDATANDPKRTPEQAAQITADIVAQLRLMADHIERRGMNGVWTNVPDNRDPEGYQRAQMRVSMRQPYDGALLLGPHLPSVKKV